MKSFKAIIICILLLFPTIVFASDTLTGNWKSEPFSQGTESVFFELNFKNDSILVLTFVNDNNIPYVGHSVASISYQGSYHFQNPTFYFYKDESSPIVVLKEFTVDDDLLKELSESDLKAMKTLYLKQLESLAQESINPFDFINFVYYVDDDDPNTIILYSDLEGISGIKCKKASPNTK